MLMHGFVLFVKMHIKGNSLMASVTERINQIKQPYGGYVKLSEFEKLQLEDGVTLNAEEMFQAH